MKLHKITDKVALNVQGHGCDTDCTEHDVLVGKKSKNTSGCVIYSTVYTPKTTSLW